MGRNQYETGGCRSTFLRTLQGVEANVSVPLDFSSRFLSQRQGGRITDSCFVLCRWDEWVPVTRLLKFNETNVALQKALSSQASQAASSSAAGSKKGAGASGAGGAGGGAGTGTGRGGRKDGRGTKRGREEVSRLWIQWCTCSGVGAVPFRSCRFSVGR